MPQPNRLATGRPLYAAGWATRITLAVQVVCSLFWLLCGSCCLVLRLRDAQSGPLLATSGVLLAACGLAQLRMLFAAWRGRRLTGSENPLPRPAFWRSLAIGALVAYLAVLAIPRTPYVGSVWLAAVCAWQTLLLLPLAASPATLDLVHKWTGGRSVRWTSWLVYACILILLVGEAGLRVNRAARDSDWFAGLSLSSREARDVRVARLKPDGFRVAILGDYDAAGRASDGYLARIEQTLPGLEIVSLGASLTASGTSAGDLAMQVDACDADLVLAVFPVCEDLARRPPECGYFDWRQFELAVLLVGSPAVAEQPTGDAPAADFESFLGALAPQLAACRTPIDDAMRDRWQQVFSSLDRVIAGCRDARVPVALVIVPSEFQVNRDLCRTLLRRYGVAAERFDVELPQRRLAGFAAHRDVPLIDLLPHFRLCRQSAYRRYATALNDEGNTAAASAIGGWLQSRYPSKLAAQLSKN